MLVEQNYYFLSLNKTAKIFCLRQMFQFSQIFFYFLYFLKRHKDILKITLKCMYSICGVGTFIYHISIIYRQSKNSVQLKHNEGNALLWCVGSGMANKFSLTLLIEVVSNCTFYINTFGTIVKQIVLNIKLGNSINF